MRATLLSILVATLTTGCTGSLTAESVDPAVSVGVPTCLLSTKWAGDGIELEARDGMLFMDGSAVDAVNVHGVLSVYGVDRTDLYAVGDEGLILRSNSRGVVWSTYRSPTDANLVAVSGFNGAKYAVGSGVAVRQAGGAWEVLPVDGDFMCLRSTERHIFGVTRHGTSIQLD